MNREQLRAFWASCVSTEKILLRLENAEARGVAGLSAGSLSRCEVPQSVVCKSVAHMLGQGLLEASGETSPRDGSVLWRITAGGRRYLAELRKEQAEERARTCQGWRQPLLFVEVR